MDLDRHGLARRALRLHADLTARGASWAERAAAVDQLVDEWERSHGSPARKVRSGRPVEPAPGRAAGPLDRRVLHAWEALTL